MSQEIQNHDNGKAANGGAGKTAKAAASQQDSPAALNISATAAVAPRRRGRPPGSGNKSAAAAATSAQAAPAAAALESAAPEVKRRGRPRKQTGEGLPAQQPEANAALEAKAARQTKPELSEQAQAPKRRGRPPKNLQQPQAEQGVQNAAESGIDNTEEQPPTSRLRQQKFQTPRRSSQTPLRTGKFDGHTGQAQQHEQGERNHNELQLEQMAPPSPRYRGRERQQAHQGAPAAQGAQSVHGAHGDYAEGNYKNNRNQRFKKNPNSPYQQRDGSPQHSSAKYGNQAQGGYTASPGRGAKFNKRQQFSRGGEYGPRHGEHGPRQGEHAPRNAEHGSRYEQGEAKDTQNYPTCEVSGVLEITPKGFGFLNDPLGRFDSQAQRVWVSMEVIRRFCLREAQLLEGTARITPQGMQLSQVTSINGIEAAQARSLPNFEDLKAVNPTKRIVLESESTNYSTRTIDIIAPIARGQRGLIVAPPRSGKTVLLHDIASSITKNHKDLKLLLLLIDERPEEVTEFRRDFADVEIYASSNDSHPREHMRIAQLCIERAKRMVEAGQHAVILMDSITRLSRAFNNYQPASGRTMSGGIDARALEVPRRLFAAARDTREAGSLTIVATALVETNSRMDDLIFQEFKGTGNMELVLNRKIAEAYIFPAIDILKSGTRREELILPDLVLSKVRLLRRALSGHRPSEAMERLLFFLKKYSSNAEMMINIKTRD